MYKWYVSSVTDRLIIWDRFDRRNLHAASQNHFCVLSWFIRNIIMVVLCFSILEFGIWYMLRQVFWPPSTHSNSMSVMSNLQSIPLDGFTRTGRSQYGGCIYPSIFSMIRMCGRWQVESKYNTLLYLTLKWKHAKNLLAWQSYFRNRWQVMLSSRTVIKTYQFSVTIVINDNAWPDFPGRAVVFSWDIAQFGSCLLCIKMCKFSCTFTSGFVLLGLPFTDREWL